MPVNERQVGGEHYGGGEYQHWDYVHDVRQPYHAACASKYIARWRKKNGAVDLQKAAHYLEKCEELGLTGCVGVNRTDNFWRLVLINDLALADAALLWYIQEGEWAEAKGAIGELLSQIASEDLQSEAGGSKSVG